MGEQAGALHHRASGKVATISLAHLSHLVGLQTAGVISEFRSVFDVVETLHTGGDAYVREAATIGLLEGIQNVAGNRRLDPSPSFPTLSPDG